MSVNSGIERYIKSVDINFDNIMKESQTESKSPIDNSDDTNDNDANTKIDPSIPQNSVIQNITEKLKDLSLEIKESDSNQRTSTSTNIEPALDSNDNNESKKDMTNLNVDLTTTANNNNINSTNNNINNTNNCTTTKDSTVNTDACLPPALMKSPNHKMKYRINEDFNKHSPMVKPQQEEKKSSKFNSDEPEWMPEILRGQEWEIDSYSNTNNNDTNNVKTDNNTESNKSTVLKIFDNSKVFNDSVVQNNINKNLNSNFVKSNAAQLQILDKDKLANPFFSIGSSTVVKKPESPTSQMAAWKRYDIGNKKFQNQINHSKIPSLNDKNILLPDTFAYKLDKKTRGSNQSQNQFNSLEKTPVSSNDNDTTTAITSGVNPKTDSFTPRSPLKLFTNLPDTFTRSKFQNILSHYEDSESSSFNNNGSSRQQQGLNTQKDNDKIEGNVHDNVGGAGEEIDNADDIETSGNLTTTTNSDNVSSKNMESKAPTLHSISSTSSSSLVSKAMNETADYNLKGVSTAERFLADGSKVLNNLNKLNLHMVADNSYTDSDSYTSDEENYSAIPSNIGYQNSILGENSMVSLNDTHNNDKSFMAKERTVDAYMKDADALYQNIRQNMNAHNNNIINNNDNDETDIGAYTSGDEDHEGSDIIDEQEEVSGLGILSVQESGIMDSPNGTRNYTAEYSDDDYSNGLDDNEFNEFNGSPSPSPSVTANVTVSLEALKENLKLGSAQKMDMKDLKLSSPKSKNISSLILDQMNSTLQDDLNEDLNKNRIQSELIQKTDKSNQNGSVNLSIESEEVSSHPGMKFIPGYQYKDTVYDKNLKKFVKTDNKTSSESKDSKHNSNDDHNTNTNNNKSDSQKVNTTEKDDMLEALNQITDVNDTTRSVVEKHSSILKKPKNVIIHRESPPEVSFFLPSNHKDSFEEELENQENESYYGKSTNKIKRNIQQDITNTSFANSDETSFRKGNASIDNTRILSDVKVADITNLDVSFSESRKALVSALTNIKPYGSWNKLEVLNLSKLGLNNLKDLDKMAPNVRNINASKNNIEYVEGIPQRVQILQISHNHISGLTSFAKYNDLQYLNLSHNKVENFRMFNELYNLRCLILKSNRIKSLRGLEDLKTLVELDISDNFLRGDLDFNNFELNFLESLNLKNNKIRSIKGLEKLKELIVLNCDHNETSSLKCNINHKNLRKLSLKLNRLTSLDLSFAVHLKELRIDGNNLREIKGLSKRLEIIEAKLQNNNDSINSLIVESCKIKKLNKLDLTGSKNTGFTIPNDFKVGLFTNISVLNLSAMNLESLPDNLGDVFPVVYDLNLNFNRLKSLKGIENMRFLVKLKVLSNNISDLKEIFDYGASFRFKLRLLDLRVNPINKSYYPYVFYKDEENGELNGTIDNLTINESDYTANNNNNNNNNNNGSTTVTPRFNNKNKRNISSIIGSSVTDILPASTPTEETRADRTSIYDESTMLHLETYEDIEAFSIEYSKLHKAQGIEEWHKRDDKHIDYLNKFTRGIRDKRRNYENSLIVWFNNISYLDGHKIESSRRHKERALFARKRKFPN